MTISESELEARLGEVEDPLVGEDIVSLALVNDVTIADGTATVSLAFNTPYAPTELDIGNRIREVVEDAGLEPRLTAEVTEDHGFDQEVFPDIRNVIAVASGKGGVGKTTVAGNLAAGLDRLGARVGLLDADVHGPNVPEVLPVDDEPAVNDEDELVPPDSDGVKVMSMQFLTREDDDPTILRGPMINNVMTHFYDNVEWGELDYLVVDLPPGTGDASLDLLQTLPVVGTVIVTTPQNMAVSDARKGVRLFEKHKTPVLGVVENMSTFHCSTCGDEHDPFGRGGADEIAEEYDIPMLGSFPIHQDYGGDGIRGPVVKKEDSDVHDPTVDIVDTIIDEVGRVNRRRVSERLGVHAEEHDEDTADEDATDEPATAE